MRPVLALLRRHGPTAFGLLLLAGAIYVVQKEFRDLSMADILSAVGAVPGSALWIAGGWTLLAYGVLTVYDRLGSVYAGKPVSYLRTSLASFCAYTLAHNLGVAAVSGAAVRYRFYAAWGLTAVEIAKVIAFTSLTFGLGGMALGGAVLVLEPEILPWFRDNMPHWAMQGIGVALLAVVGAYLVLSRVLPHFTIFGHKIDLPGFRMALMQTTLAVVDVVVTTMIFYVLLPPAEGLTFVRFLGIYLAAYSAGLAANVPGGLGVFDTVILLALQPYVPAPQVIGALFLFRLYYYIVPLFIAGALFAGFELSQRRHLLGSLGTEARVADSLEGPALSGLSAVMGVALLFIGALPSHGTWLAEWAGEWAALAGHFAASVIGSLLLVMAYGMLRRLRIARIGGIVLLLLGAAAVALKGEPWWLVVIFLLPAGLLAGMRSTFYRDARLTGEPLSFSTVISLTASLLCALLLASIAWSGPVTEDPWWMVPFSSDTPASLRLAVGVAGVLLLVAVFRLLRPSRLVAAPYDEAARARLKALGATVPEEADGAILVEGAGFAFRKLPDTWIGLGDPAGEEQARITALWRFRDICERNGVSHAFWRVGRTMLRAYEDTGLAAVALPDGSFLAADSEGDPSVLLKQMERG
ncbi:lysylphosphatidylglycerol synthetase family protein [Roseomonas ludipueritiae]|uniref:Lysylphosphatidylglycerol synthetase family protein n=1 Tax=Pseudoroseomonas ludipueritiae TaxID=198093 RepID=A0ABR7R3P2_9PROT|nr:lysylphosphatidylglycerol synthetase family protein [Pseudoroseomonas ludipueritiae]